MIKQVGLGLSMLVVAFLVRNFVFSFAVVHGDSMEPKYKNGDLLIVKKWHPSTNPGDVAIFKDEVRGQKWVKRIIARGPALVAINNYQIFVDQKPYLESVEDPPIWQKDKFSCRDSNEYTLKEGEVFFIGDNRCDSLYGIKKINDVTGVIYFNTKMNFSFLTGFFWEEIEKDLNHL